MARILSSVRACYRRAHMGRSHRAVLFDFGGTLYSYRSGSGRALGAVRDAAARLGVSDRARIAAAYREGSLRAYERYAQLPYYLHRDMFRETFRVFARELGSEPDDAFLDWFHEAQRVAVLEHFTLRADCVAVLERLRAGGLHVGVVSNIDDDYLVPMLERAGLAPLLDAWTSSEQARSCKPDRRIFELALEKAGARADQTLFVGDSLEADVAGARAMGMTAVHLCASDAFATASGALPAAEPHHVIGELGDLLAVLELE
jgi:HAD superfamily hydrolase (TIGR01509 family)